MNAPLTTRTFRNGNSVALRLPKGLGIGPDQDMLVERRGGELVVRPKIDPMAEKARLRAFLAEFDALPKPGYIQTREPIEFRD